MSRDPAAAGSRLCPTQKIYFLWRVRLGTCGRVRPHPRGQPAIKVPTILLYCNRLYASIRNEPLCRILPLYSSAARSARFSLLATGAIILGPSDHDPPGVRPVLWSHPKFSLIAEGDTNQCTALSDPFPSHTGPVPLACAAATMDVSGALAPVVERDLREASLRISWRFFLRSISAWATASEWYRRSCTNVTQFGGGGCSWRLASAMPLLPCPHFT